MMMKMKSIQLFFFFALCFSLSLTNALVPNHHCLSCKHSNFLTTPSWTSRPKTTIPFSKLYATAVDDSLVETQQQKQQLQPPSPPPSEEGDLDLSSRIVNGVFLALAFGYAAYTIFNIDSGMTRGWTTGEIAMRIPLDNWGAYESYLANKPIFTKTLINVIIYLLGDWLSQTAFQGKNVLDFDIKRTLRNGFIGLCFGPLVHEYYQFSDTILPPENGLVTRLEKIFMDQTIYLSVKCSIYISAVGFLRGDDWPTVKQTVQDKILGICFTAWKFWPLVHCITYGLIPARHRILWVNSVDLVWNAILASQASKNVNVEEEDGNDKSIVLEAVAVEVSDDTAHAADQEVPVLVLEKDLVDLKDINKSAGTNSTKEMLVSN